MRGSSAKQRSEVQERQGKIAKESDQIMRKIEQIKQEMSPQMEPHSRFTSEHREKWYQYLPAENNQRSFASHSQKEEVKVDHYRQSLQQRLEKLFREEKDLLKERHFGSSLQAPTRPKDSQSKGLAISQSNANSIDHMERKIRLLEEKYRHQKAPIANKKELHATTGENEGPLQHRQPSSRVGKRGRVKSGAERGATEPALGESGKSHQLQLEMEELKSSILEIKVSNKQLSQKILEKEERRKHKHRTKEILLNILHKLEFINVEMHSAQKKNRSSSKKSRMERQAEELMEEFGLLKVQYRHFDQERKTIEKRHQEIESKLGRLIDSK